MESIIKSKCPYVPCNDSDSLITELNNVSSAGGGKLRRRWSSGELLACCNDLLSRPIPSLTLPHYETHTPSNFDRFCENLAISVYNEIFSHDPENVFLAPCVSGAKCLGNTLPIHLCQGIDSAVEYNSNTESLGVISKDPNSSSSSCFGSCKSGIFIDLCSEESLIDFVSCSSVSSVSGKPASNAGVTDTQTSLFIGRCTKEFVDRCKPIIFTTLSAINDGRRRLICQRKPIHYHSTECISGTFLNTYRTNVCQKSRELGASMRESVYSSHFLRKYHSVIPLSNTSPVEINSSQSPCYEWGKEIKRKEGNSSASLPSSVPSDVSVCSQPPRCQSCQTPLVAVPLNSTPDKQCVASLSKGCKECVLPFIEEDRKADDIYLPVPTTLLCNSDNDILCDFKVLLAPKMSQSDASDNLTFECAAESKGVRDVEFCSGNGSNPISRLNTARDTPLTASSCHEATTLNSETNSCATPFALNMCDISQETSNLYHAIPALVSSDTQEEEEDEEEGINEDNINVVRGSRMTEQEKVSSCEPFNLSVLNVSPLVRDNNNEAAVGGSSEHPTGKSRPIFISAVDYARFNMLSSEGGHESQHSVISGNASEKQTSTDKGVNEETSSPPQICTCKASTFGGIYFFVAPFVWWYPLFLPCSEDVAEFYSLQNFQWCLATSGEFWQLLLDYDGRPTIYQKETMSGYVPQLQGGEKQSLTSKLCGFSISAGENTRVKTLLPVFNSRNLCNSARDVTNSVLLRPKSDRMDSSISQRHSASCDVGAYRMDSIVLVPGGKPPYLPEGPPCPSSIKLCGITLGSVDHVMDREILPSSPEQKLELPLSVSIHSENEPLSHSEHDIPNRKASLYLPLIQFTPSIMSNPQSPSVTLSSTLPSINFVNSSSSNETYSPEFLKPSLLSIISKDIPFGEENSSPIVQDDFSRSTPKSDNLSSFPPVCCSEALSTFTSAESHKPLSFASYPYPRQLINQHITQDKEITSVDNLKYSNSTSNSHSHSAFSCTYSEPCSVSFYSTSSPVACSFCSFNASPIPYGCGYGTSANTSRASSRSSCYEVDSGSTTPVCFPPLFVEKNKNIPVVEKASFNSASQSSSDADGFTGPHMPLTHPPGTTVIKESSREFVSDDNMVTSSSAGSYLPTTSPITDLCTLSTCPLPLGSSCPIVLKKTESSFSQNVPDNECNMHYADLESKFDLEAKSYNPNLASSIEHETDTGNLKPTESFNEIQYERYSKESTIPSLSSGNKETHSPQGVDASFKGSQNRNCGSKFPLDVLCRGRVFELQKRTTSELSSEDSNYPRRRLASFDHFQPPSSRNNHPFSTTRSKSAGRMEFGPAKLDLNKSLGSKESCIDEVLESSVESLSLMSSTDLAGNLYNLQGNCDTTSTLPVRHWDQSSLAASSEGHVISFKFAPTSALSEDPQQNSGLESDKLSEMFPSVDATAKILSANVEIFPKINTINNPGRNEKEDVICHSRSDLQDSDSMICNQSLEMCFNNLLKEQHAYNDQVQYLSNKGDLSSLKENCQVKLIPHTASFIPYKMDERVFQAKIGQSSKKEGPFTCAIHDKESNAAEKRTLLDIFCENTVNAIFNWTDLESLIVECKTNLVEESSSEKKMEGFFESAISVLVDEVSDEEERSSPEIREQEIFVSVLEVQQFVPNFCNNGSTSTLVGNNSPSGTPLHTPTPSTLPILATPTEYSEVSTIEEDLSNDELLKDEFEDIHEKESASKYSDATSWSAYPSETEKSTSSICSSECTLPIELQHDCLASASASSTGSAYSWESLQGPVARRELLPLDEDEEARWKAVLSVPESDEDKTGYESDDDFESMDVEMRRLEEKLKKFEMELGISSSDVSSERKEASGTQVYLRQRDIEELKNFKLPSVYPTPDKLRTKHLSLMKKDDRDFGVDSDCDSKYSNKASSNDSGEMLFLKSKVKLKPGDRRCRSAFINTKQDSKDQASNSSNIDSKESSECSINDEVNASDLQTTIPGGTQDIDSRASSEDEVIQNIHMNQNCLGYLWHEDDGMTALDFDELEEFQLVDIGNSVFFIFEDDEEDEVSEVGEANYEYSGSYSISPRASDSESNPSFSERKPDKSFVSAFKNSVKKAAKYLGPKTTANSKNDSDLLLNSFDNENVNNPRKLSGVYNVPTGMECEVRSFESDCGDGFYSSGEYHASPAICIVTSDEDQHSSSSVTKIHHERNSPLVSQNMHPQDYSNYLHCEFSNLNCGDEGTLSPSKDLTNSQDSCWYDVVKSASACSPLQTDIAHQVERERISPRTKEPFLRLPSDAPPVPPRSCKYKHKKHPYDNIQNRHNIKKSNLDSIEKQIESIPPQSRSPTCSVSGCLSLSSAQGRPFSKVDEFIATGCVEPSIRTSTSSQAGNHTSLSNSDPKSSSTRRSWPPRVSLYSCPLSASCPNGVWADRTLFVCNNNISLITYKTELALHLRDECYMDHHKFNYINIAGSSSLSISSPLSSIDHGTFHTSHSTTSSLCTSDSELLWNPKPIAPADTSLQHLSYCFQPYPESTLGGIAIKKLEMWHSTIPVCRLFDCPLEKEVLVQPHISITPFLTNMDPTKDSCLTSSRCAYDHSNYFCHQKRLWSSCPLLLFVGTPPNTVDPHTNLKCSFKLPETFQSCMLCYSASESDLSSEVGSS